MEVPEIVGDDMGSSRCKGALNYEIVLWIREERSPPEINVRFQCDAAKIVQKVSDPSIVQSRNHSRPLENILILKDQRRGCGNRHLALRHQLEEMIGSSAPRSQASHNHIRIKNDPHPGRLSPGRERSTHRTVRGWDLPSQWDILSQLFSPS